MDSHILRKAANRLPALADLAVLRFNTRGTTSPQGTSEGSFGDGASMVISEWPDKASALAFWNSPEYAQAKKLREGIADCQVLLIEAGKING